MKILMLIVSILFLSSTIICGLWIRYSGREIKDESVKFHMLLAIATAIIALITMLVLR